MVSDETFHFIAGYTSNGVPFGVTWEEMRGEREESTEIYEMVDSDDVPFQKIQHLWKKLQNISS